MKKKRRKKKKKILHFLFQISCISSQRISKLLTKPVLVCGKSTVHPQSIIT